MSDTNVSRIYTKFGDMLRITDEGRAFTSRQGFFDDTIYACTHPRLKSGIFLVAAKAVPKVFITPKAYRDGIAPLGTLRNQLDNSLCLYDLFSGTFMCAPPRKGEDAAGALFLNREKPSAWEKFFLQATNEETLPAHVDLVAASINDIFSMPSVFDSIKSAIKDLAPSQALMACLGAASKFLNHSEVAELSYWLVSQSDLARFRCLFPEDIWAEYALPSLATWIATRKTETLHQDYSEEVSGAGSRRIALQNAAQRSLGSTSRVDAPNVPEPGLNKLAAELNDVVHRDSSVHNFSLPYVCNLAARKGVRPSRTVCVLTTVRNEGLYLLEWLAYHRVVGVEDFIIYSNNNSDGSDHLLRELASSGFITWIDNNAHLDVSPQYKAYGHALSVSPLILDFEWAAIIDLDEFIVLDQTHFSGLQEFLSWQRSKSADAVALNWLVYGSSGHSSWTNEGVLGRFRMRSPQPNPHIKAIVRPHHFAHSQCHFPITADGAPFSFTTALGEPYRHSSTAGSLAIAERPIAEFAWINHYYDKSVEEFLLKLARGRADLNGYNGQILAHETTSGRVESMVQSFMARFGSRDYIPDGMPSAITTRVKEELDRILGCGNIRQAYLDVLANFGLALQQARDQLLGIPETVLADTTRDKFLEMLEGKR
jgi:hypothetical protein